jgi:hypothetical protein
VPPFCVLVALLAGGLGMPLAHGREAEADGHRIRSVFFVAKSENKNQVHYGIRVDDTCTPAGSASAFAYWRMLERGPFATEPLLARVVPAYGVAAQRSSPREGGGGRVVLTLNALPKRTIVIDTVGRGPMCTASAGAVIGGVAAALTNIFVQLRWPFGVEYIVISGRSADGGVVRERVGN